MPSRWSVSTEQGSTLTADELVGVLTTHQERLLRSWQSFSDEQWDHPSRNASWSVHDTVRHVADVMQGSAAGVRGESSPFKVDGFDPNATPDVWLAASADDPPARTIERFAEAAPRWRERVGERAAADDASIGRTVYGPAHWSVGVVHVFWDSWLHERDVLLPLSLPAESSIGEQRLAGLYGALMALVPARMMEQPITTSIAFGGLEPHAVAVSHDGGRLVSSEADADEAVLAADAAAVIDSLSGRGDPVSLVLPGAPEELGILAAFLQG